MKHILVLTLLLFLPVAARAADKPKPVKVFILAGQSNMEGKAQLKLLDYQAQQPATSDLYKHLRKDDKWIERDDVWIKFLDRKGKLTVGYGSPKCIGPELEFGTVVGDHYDEQVLLIKTAWGGRSLFRDFRSPSAGLPPADVLDALLAKAKKNKPETTLDDIKKPFGASYRATLDEIKQTLEHMKEHFPDYAGQGYEIAGFIWFQGWNDMIDATATGEYAVNMAHFIRDVRKDLNVPKLPFVIGQMGVDGDQPSEGVKKFKAAQAAVMDVAEFKGNVALVKTDAFWDTDAAAVFKKGWRENMEEWNKVGSDFPYHYLGSPKTMLRIGRAFGKAVLELREEIKHETRDVEGWTVQVDVQLLSGPDAEMGSKALRTLGSRLADIKTLLPADRIEKLQKVTIYLDRSHPRLKSMQYHPSVEWLKQNGHDPAMAKAVHLPQARELTGRFLVNKQPMAILHELAHAYHDQVLSFDEPRIKAAWARVKDSGKFDKVMHISGSEGRHYALTNQMEFFAEMTESFFGTNDFYPFVRGELKKELPEVDKLLEEIWLKEEKPSTNSGTGVPARETGAPRVNSGTRE